MTHDHTSSDEPRLELPALPPVIFAIPLLGGLLAHAIFDLPRLAMARPTAWSAGGIVAVLALALGFWAIRAFQAHGENPHPPSPTSVIVETGPYRFSRNPMYLAMALLATGIGVALRSWVVLASVPISLAAIHWLVVRREETHLGATLGEPYLRYLERVRRYL
jgi:protein-S-isoprenylcysteine O-methyltransferase Ste14